MAYIILLLFNIYNEMFETFRKIFVFIYTTNHGCPHVKFICGWVGGGKISKNES